MLEGSCLSLLGRVEFDLATGAATMTDLFAVFAGGFVEAKRLLKVELRQARVWGQTCALLSCVSLLLAGGLFYYKHAQAQQE